MSKGEEDIFTVVDRVLRKNIHQEQRKGGKMEPDLLGPFAIVNIEGKSADLLQCNGRTIEKINIDHLKRYVEPQPRIPAKWIALSPLIPQAQQTSSCLSPAVPQSLSETISLQSPIKSLSETISLQSPIKSLSDTISLQSPIKSPNDSICQHSPMVPQRLSETPSPQSDPMSRDTASSRTIPEELIADIWSGKRQSVLWSKVGPYKLFARDLQNLAPGRELESEVLNAFIHVIIQKLQQERLKRFYLVDSFAMSALWHGSFQGLKKVDPMAYDVLLGPVCDNRHWTLVVLYPKERLALYIDPLGETPDHIIKCRDVTRAFMRHKNIHISRWTCDTINHPRQQDATSCGVFVCKGLRECLPKSSKKQRWP
ncbi:sentrin-specific protease 2-like [Notolabrus celidotus]|uniref:sentrin-specific protease 2-like n=1 Tax=Notolabrus celidotus TaxID=1203425 RepID=UPI00148FFF90|nr:sentrin-specific protease 2-like [Notolabrus celidotus]